MASVMRCSSPHYGTQQNHIDLQSSITALLFSPPHLLTSCAAYSCNVNYQIFYTAWALKNILHSTISVFKAYSCNVNYQIFYTAWALKNPLNNLSIQGRSITPLPSKCTAHCLTELHLFFRLIYGCQKNLKSGTTLNMHPCTFV